MPPSPLTPEALQGCPWMGLRCARMVVFPRRIAHQALQGYRAGSFPVVIQEGLAPQGEKHAGLCDPGHEEQTYELCYQRQAFQPPQVREEKCDFPATGGTEANCG